MPKYRDEISRKSAYWIPKSKLRAARFYCFQYPEWIKEYRELVGVKGAAPLSGMPRGSGMSDPTEHNAIKRAELSKKIKLIENTVREVEPDIAEWLLIGVTNEDATYEYLRMVKNMPCCKNIYYLARKKFYYLMSERI